MQISIQGQFNLKICYSLPRDTPASSNSRKLVIAVLVQTPAFLVDDHCSSESANGKLARWVVVDWSPSPAVDIVKSN
jgi:hypothetical protein